MATGRVAVWNMALARIGVSRRLTTGNENNPEAEQCNLWWDDVLRRILERWPWPFAITQTTLTESEVTREGWEHVYELPSDLVTPLALLAEDERITFFYPEQLYTFDIQANDTGDGKLLLCDLDASDGDFEVFEYVFKHEYVPTWPATFTSSIAYLLASELALSLKKDIGLHRRMYEFYGAMVKQAISESQSRRRGERNPDTPMIAARDGGWPWPNLTGKLRS